MGKLCETTAFVAKIGLNFVEAEKNYALVRCRTFPADLANWESLPHWRELAWGVPYNNKNFATFQLAPVFFHPQDVPVRVPVVISYTRWTTNPGKILLFDQQLVGKLVCGIFESGKYTSKGSVTVFSAVKSHSTHQLSTLEFNRFCVMSTSFPPPSFR